MKDYTRGERLYGNITDEETEGISHRDLKRAVWLDEAIERVGKRTEETILCDLYKAKAERFKIGLTH